MATKVVLTIAMGVATIVVSLIAVEIFWSTTPHSPYSRPGPPAGLVLALAVMVPILHKIWHQPAVKFLTYAAFAAAFVCLWTAASSSREEPFTDAQWRLLGFTLLIVGAAIGLKYRNLVWPNSGGA